MKIFALLATVATVLLLYSATLDPFKSGGEAVWRSSVPAGNSQAYEDVRNAELTPKYRLQDYSVTLLVLACVAAAYSSVGLRHAPKHNLSFAFLASAAPGLTAFAFVYDLVLGYLRFKFPPWGDSLGIPLMGVPVILLVGLLWSAVHLALLRGMRLTGEAFTLEGLRSADFWLKFVTLMTLILIALGVAGGLYWYVIPALLWLYFYLSIAVTRVGNSYCQTTGEA